MAARNGKTGLAGLEKTHPSPATLPDLQTQGQNSRWKDSMSEIASPPGSELRILIAFWRAFKPSLQPVHHFDFRFGTA
jgi:hypothetical protein